MAQRPQRRARLTGIVGLVVLVGAVGAIIAMAAAWDPGEWFEPEPAPYVESLPPGPQPTETDDGTCREPDPDNPEGCLTPTAASFREQVQVAFGDQQMSCWSEHAWNPDSDHPEGRACDIFPEEPGEVPSLDGEIEGWHIAEWSRVHADALRIDYIIWWGHIWTDNRSWMGWQPYDGDGIYDVEDPTGGHFDHIHISVR